jgi:protein tyrosine/serine phosphatase
MLVMIAGTFGVYWYRNLQTYHLAPVQIGVLYRDGNRDLREFTHALKLTQAKTVVSLIDDHELNDPTKPQFLQETNYCTANGIQYIRIPVQLGGWPSSEDLKTFIRIVTDPVNQPVLVHCAQGVRRTGMFVAAFQESVLHESPDQTKNEILGFGHKAADTDDVRSFIDDYDPVKQTLPPKERGASAE